ncbi:MAG: hypothetical protein WCI51_07635 [Lentisphaerota bacterium]
MQSRKYIYGTVADWVNFNDIYDEIIKISHDSTEACYAMVYKNAPLIESLMPQFPPKRFKMSKSSSNRSTGIRNCCCRYTCSPIMNTSL